MLKRINIFLVLIFLEGLLPVFLYFQVPSMQRNAFLWGFSRSRLLIGAAFIFLLVLIAGFGLLFNLSASFRQKIAGHYANWLNDERLLVSSASLVGVVFSIFLMFWWVGLETTIDLNTFEVIFRRLRWFAMWFGVVSAQFLAFLFMRYKEKFKQQGFFNRSIILCVVMVFLFIDSSLFHWIILEYEIQVFASLPYWTWFIQRKDANLAAVALLFLLSFAVILLVLWRPKWNIANFSLLILLGYLLQLGYGFVEGEGVQSIQAKTTNAGHVWYLEHAVDNIPFSSALFHYEENFGSNVYLGTKPPGILIYYLIHQRLSNSIFQVQGYQARFDRLLEYITYLFPFLTFLAILPLVFFSKKYISAPHHFMPAVLFIFLPNIILMPMELDQVLFPTLFLIGLILTQITIEKRTLLWGLITGIYLYIAVFFTFSMVPLVLLSITWIGLDYWFHRKERDFIELVKIGLGIGFAFGVMFLIGYLVLNYDMFTRYQNAMRVHKTLKEFQPGIGQILYAIRLNNLEIASWIGFPIAILSLNRVLRSIGNLISKSLHSIDILTIASFVVYTVLNILGQTRGEVGRLWIFMTPLFVTFAAYEIMQYFRKARLTVVFLVVLQFITTLMIFRCQDFW